MSENPIIPNMVSGQAILPNANLMPLFITIITHLYIVRKIRPPGELMRKDKLVEISGGKCVASDVLTASAAINK